MQFTNKNKLKIIITVIFSVLIAISILFNGYLYIQLSYTNKDITVIKVQQEDIQDEYNSLLQKIEDSKKSLQAQQKENTELKKMILTLK